MLYAMPRARVIFMTKTCLGIFSLVQEQVLMYSVLGDGI